MTETNLRRRRAPIRLRIILAGILIFFFVGLAGVRDVSAQASNARVALVIGNSAYTGLPAPLKHPVNNAHAFAEELERLGFEVEIGADLTRQAMRSAIDRFYGKIEPGATALLFFSGYGIQSTRKDYIFPVNAQIWMEADVRRDGFSLDTILNEMNSKGARVKIAILDASRRNPFEVRFRAFAAGLAAATTPPSTAVMYAAAPGTVMRDNERELFVSELLKEIRTPGKVEEAFQRTLIGVSRASQGEQVPWFSSSLVEDFSFVTGGRPGRPLGPPIAVAPPPSSRPPEPVPAPDPVPAPAPRPAPEQLLPEFPWPPPTASASYVLPKHLFKRQHTAGEVVSAILAALERNGYVERSFFRTQPGGVALVTRLERIKVDGSYFVEPKRWPTSEQTHASTADLIRFFRGLFFVDPGRYRVIVFILQDLPFSQSSQKITREEARAWLSSGANILPPEIAARPFGGGHCTVLVYEFASDGTAVRVVESRLTGKQHLEKAGVLSLLGKVD